MPTPDAERRRADARREYAIHDISAIPGFDQVVRTTARLFGVPIALISLLDETRQRFTARVGLELSEIEHESAFCLHTVAANQVTVVPDARSDARFARTPPVAGEPGIRFYAGAPLTTRDGEVLGTLCIMDTKPRPTLSQEASGALEALARVVVAELDARRAALKAAAWSATVERARAAEAHFRFLFERNPNPMWVYDRETWKFLEVNEAAVEFYGWSRDEFRQMTILDLRPPEDVLRLVEALKASDHTRSHGEWRHRKRDGQVIDVLVAAYHGAGYEGRQAGLVVVHDITARKKMEQALAESEARFRNIADSIPGMLWMTDVEDRTVFVNRHWRDYTSCQTDDAVTDTWMSHVHPDDLHEVIEVAHIGSRARQPYTVTYRLRRHDGEYRWFLDTGTPRFSPDGSFLGYIGAALDMTDQRRLETQLHQAQKMQAVGQLTGGIAHDFNNLLTVILGNSELIAAEVANDPFLSQLSEMTRKAADRGAGLVRRLLAFSRGQMLRPQVTDINRLLADMNERLLRALGEDIDVALDLSGDLWTACIDPEQLENALLNLCVNARDAMPEGGRLVIETRNLTATDSNISADERVVPGDYLAITVTDTGAGMPPEVAARAFEPFFTTKGVGKGTGLGLSMVYGFVKQSDGYVSLASKPGAGTVFTILLPRAVSSSVQPVAAGSVTAAPAGSGQTILLVEDEPLVSSMLSEQLKRLGYVVVTAANGPDALARWTSGPISICC